MTLANGSVLSGSTGSKGTFTAPDIPLGTYTATISGIGFSGQVSGDASKHSVANASLLFSTTSLGVTVVIVVIVVGIAVFLARRRSPARAEAPSPASAAVVLP
jgi:heme/copper-type cytochrome/quinol oxidase subunit 2